MDTHNLIDNLFMRLSYKSSKQTNSCQYQEATMVLSTTLQILVLVAAASARQINFHNNCGKTIWVSPLTNAQGPVLGGGVQQVNAGT